MIDVRYLHSSHNTLDQDLFIIISIALNLMCVEYHTENARLLQYASLWPGTLEDSLEVTVTALNLPTSAKSGLN